MFEPRSRVLAQDFMRFDGHEDFRIRLRPVASRRDGWHPEPLRSLGDLSRLDAGSLSADEALSALTTLQRERACLDALEAQLLVRAAGATRFTRDVLVDHDESDPSARPRRVEIVDEVVDEIAACLHRAPGTMRAEVGLARLLHGPLRATRDALARGEITAAHVRVIADQARRLRPDGVPAGDEDPVFGEACARLQDRVLSHAGSETVSQTRQRARRVVASIDPDGIAARRRRMRCTREVRGWAEDDGIGVVQARLAAPDAAWMVAAVDAHARAHVNDDRFDLHPDATWGEVQAAALVDLLRHRDGDAASPAVGVELQVLIDLPTLCGPSGRGTALVQVGGETSEVDRDDLLDLLQAANAPVAVRRLLADPLTGALVDQGARRYVAGHELVAWLRARDQRCRFPGCSRRARGCDVDHAVDFADGGSTTLANTGLLCRRHHNLKTHAGWTIEESDRDGSCTFVSPKGHRYVHEPVELLPPPAPPPAAAQAKPPPEPESPPF
jgi:hypothetical protein